MCATAATMFVVVVLMACLSDSLLWWWNGCASNRVWLVVRIGILVMGMIIGMEIGIRGEIALARTGVAVDRGRDRITKVAAVEAVGQDTATEAPQGGKLGPSYCRDVCV